jgi:hypothetical protein
MNFGDRYGTLDRLLYRVAFRAGTAQHALSDVEGTLYAGRLEGVTADDPVFITALPRSGTTILLKLLWQTGHFATHTYQDMPFVLCPLIWSRYSDRFAEEIEPTERAHADGLKVSGKSPEAFEEMVWKHFWPGHYGKDRIRPWQPEDRNREFNTFFRKHMRKIIAVRKEADGETGSDEPRYLSKNNLHHCPLGGPARTAPKGHVSDSIPGPGSTGRLDAPAARAVSGDPRGGRLRSRVHGGDRPPRVREGTQAGKLQQLAGRRLLRSKRPGVLAPVLDREYDLTKPQGVDGRNSDNTKILDEFGWEPLTALRDGMEVTAEWTDSIRVPTTVGIEEQMRTHRGAETTSRFAVAY